MHEFGDNTVIETRDVTTAKDFDLLLNRYTRLGVVRDGARPSPS
jgi:hypothetical protein